MLKLNWIMRISIKFSFILLAHLSLGDIRFVDEKLYHQPLSIGSEEFLSIANLSDESRFRNILSNILIERVVGTPSHEKVKDYIAQSMENLNWEVEADRFRQKVPKLGQLNFTNIVARLNPNAKRYLTIACHYDSKYMPGQPFLAATDSAVPCAMMLDMAYALSERLEPYRSSNVSLMFVFFDGEEAFERWGPNDSIYGAKHLSRLWQQLPYTQIKGAKQVDRMDMLVLLDLLGAPDPKFYDYYEFSASRYHKQLCGIEDSLHQLRLLSNYSPRGRYFLRVKSNSHIEDDHLAFVDYIDRPVPVLHVIPSPFPSVWHTVEDNFDALDFPTIDNLNKIFRIFTMSYLSGSFSEQRYLRLQKRFADSIDDNGYVLGDDYQLVA